MTSDELQNELLLIAHHVDDIEEQMKSGSVQPEYIRAALRDIRHSLYRMGKSLSPKQQAAIDKIAESLDEL